MAAPTAWCSIVLVIAWRRAEATPACPTGLGPCADRHDLMLQKSRQGVHARSLFVCARVNTPDTKLSPVCTSVALSGAV